MVLPAIIKSGCWFILFACLSYFCAAQEILNPSVKAKLLTRFPFKQYSGGVMVISAKFDTINDTLHFILDTGGGGISLDSTTCVRYNIKTTPSDTMINGMGGIRRAAYVFNKSIHFPGLSVDRLNFHISNYSLLTSVYGERIDGIIGYSFFKRFIVKADFDSCMIEIYANGKIEYARGGIILHPTINKIPVQNLTIKDRKKVSHDFFFDTGAGLCLLLNSAYATDSNVLLNRRRPVSLQAEGMGGKLQMKLTVIKFVQIGKYRFNNVPTYIYEDESNVTAYPGGGRLVGNDLLRRFNLTINYPAGEIYLTPNSHFSDLFDYSYTGLGIYYEAGTIYIEDIMPGSPGEKAGVKQGDILIGVNNNFSNNIMQYKSILQTEKEKINLVVKRKGELKLLVIKPGSIY